MGWTQPDKWRRTYRLGGGGKWACILQAFGRNLMRAIGVEECPINKPVLIGTGEGAAQQLQHQDARYEASWSILLAVTRRPFLLYNGEGKVRLKLMLKPGDVLVFDARICHSGAAGARPGRGPDAFVGTSFGARMYAGKGIQVWDLVNSARCGLLLTETTSGGKEADEKEGERMNTGYGERLHGPVEV